LGEEEGGQAKNTGRNLLEYEDVSTSETSVNSYQTTRRNIPEDIFILAAVRNGNLTETIKVPLDCICNRNIFFVISVALAISSYTKGLASSAIVVRGKTWELVSRDRSFHSFR
jgi:hypothetical protein